MFAPTSEDIRFYESLYSRNEILDSSVIDRYEAYIESQHEEASRRIVAERRAEARGRDEEKRSIARNMLEEGIGLEVIADITGLSAEEIKALQPAECRYGDSSHRLDHQPHLCRPRTWLEVIALSNTAGPS